MEANTYVDEEMSQRDPDIGDLLEQLAGKIKAGMTGTALKFYEREFTFFRKVTNISGIIRPYPKGPQRNAECLKALKEVELLPGESSLSLSLSVFISSSFFPYTSLITHILNTLSFYLCHADTRLSVTKLTKHEINNKFTNYCSYLPTNEYRLAVIRTTLEKMCIILPLTEAHMLISVSLLSSPCRCVLAQ